MRWLQPSSRLLSMSLVVLAACAANGAGVKRSGHQPDSGDYVSLVQQLNDSRFAVRQCAGEQLVRAGVAALPAVEAGRASRDAETRLRCQQIAESIRLDQRRRVLDAFLANVELPGANQLPGWMDFQQRVGRDRAARALFVSILESEWPLLTQVYERPERAHLWVAERCEIFQNHRRYGGQAVPLGSIAALLFVAGQDDVSISERTSSFLFSFCYQPVFQQAIRAGAQSTPLRKLLGAFVARGQFSSPAPQALYFSLRYDLKEGLALARNVLENRSGNAQLRQLAIQTLAKLGDVDDLPLIQSMLDDVEVCSRQTINRQPYTTQVRDVALAALVCRAGEDPADYGFATMQKDATTLFVISTVGFPSDDERQKAIERWQGRKEE